MSYYIVSSRQMFYPLQRGYIMYKRRASVICTMLCCLLLLSCGSSPSPVSQTTATPISTRPLPSPTPSPTPTPTGGAPKRYTLHMVLQGVDRPDDLAFDREGRLL